MACSGKASGKCCYGATPNARPTRDECLDCTICLESAVDPVVTLCGHLYCWPCIYKWLQVDGSASPPQCPVCKAPLSENALVPLYSHGGLETNERRLLDVPSRPNAPMREQPHGYCRYDSYCGSQPGASVLGSTGGGVLLGLAVAVNPGRHNADLMRPYGYRLETYDGSSVRERRWELAVEETLHQICVFLFCSAVFCLLFF